MNIFLLILSIIGILLALFLGLLLYRVFLRYSTEIDSPNGISSLEEIRLGGVKQWIFIRGIDQNNPVLVILHGGPGAPIPGISSARKLDKELIKYFTVVHWDQRGTGKSYNREIPVESLNLDRFVEDLSELIEFLRLRFSTQKVFIVAHSGGTLIGLRTACKYPEKIHAYVGIAQQLNIYEQERVSYDFILKEAIKTGDVSKQEAIKAIGLPPYDSYKKINEKAKYIDSYRGFVYNQPLKVMGTLVTNFLTSPEYSLKEGINTLRNKGYSFTQNAMWEEIKNIKLNKEIQSIKVPIYFFEGKYDMTVPTVLVEEFFDQLVAEKGKKLIIFENSAHFPMLEEKKRYEELLIDVVLKGGS
ncbi:MAG: alpha/beta fold hydrolase [Candidatus Hodarchaeota archaeon]